MPQTADPSNIETVYQHYTSFMMRRIADDWDSYERNHYRGQPIMQIVRETGRSMTVVQKGISSVRMLVAYYKLDEPS